MLDRASTPSGAGEMMIMGVGSAVEYFTCSTKARSRQEAGSAQLLGLGATKDPAKLILRRRPNKLDRFSSPF